MAGSVVLHLLDNPWLEPLALRGASRRASRLSEEARQRMKPWVVAAHARFRVARELRDAETQAVALALLREAAFFALCALEAADSAPAVERTAKEAWQRFDALPEQPAGAPENLAQVRALFATDDALAVDRMASDRSEPNQANELRLAAEASVAWLLALAEVRTQAELSRARIGRSLLAACGLIAGVSALIAYFLSLTAIAPP